MDLDFDDASAGELRRAVRGLRRYTELVATELGMGRPGLYLQVDRPMTVYLPLDVRLGRFPEHDTALVWHEERGWAVGVETDARSPIALITFQHTEVLPAPREVAQFVDDVVTERYPGQPDPPTLRAARADDDLLERLAAYAPIVAAVLRPAPSAD